MRNQDVGRGANTIDMFPDRIVITRAEWTDSPWVFNRDSITGQPGSGGGRNNRVAIDYTPVRSVSGTAAQAGVSQNDEFTITLEWD